MPTTIGKGIDFLCLVMIYFIVSFYEVCGARKFTLVLSEPFVYTRHTRIMNLNLFVLYPLFCVTAVHLLCKVCEV